MVPELREARRILAVQPHYDDNDIAAGGTLAALADAGCEVHYLTVTDDLVGVLDPALSDEEATRALRAEQHRAGREIGVASQTWLGLPDGGPCDAFALRREIVRHVRRLRPDFLFSVDPWLPFEAHPDHLVTGRAVAEAALFYRFARFATDPAVDAAYEPHDLRGLALYFTVSPNVAFDIDTTRERKHRALDAYRMQFSPEALAALHRGLDAKEREWAAAGPASHAEALRVLAPRQLHCHLGP